MPTEPSIRTDPTGVPRKHRVRNLDEFHAAFATGPGDELWLDPDQRVRIW